MSLEEYRTLYEQEDHFWWYRGMRAITEVIINRFLNPAPRGRCLDAGCGTGANLHFLSRWYDCLGLDVAYEAMPFLVERGHTNITLASVQDIPFADDSFDLVTAFEVIQCSPSDDRALEEIFRVIKPGGHVLIREVAFPILSGEHDLATKIKRRYKKNELERKMTHAGFRMVWRSYSNFFLFPPILALRSFRRWKKPAINPAEAVTDFRFSPTLLNRFFARFLMLEAWWMERFAFPFGVSIFVLGQKEA